jgi:DNA-directed RNA polymerase specialized sigma24 family protein
MRRKSSAVASGGKLKKLPRGRDADKPTRRLDASGERLLLEHYSGSDEAFDQFVSSHRAWMNQSVSRLLSRPPTAASSSVVDVDDIVQSVLIAIYEQAPRAQRRSKRQLAPKGKLERRHLYDPARGSVRAWLYMLLMSRTLLELRRRKKSEHYDEARDTRIVEPDAEQSAFTNEFLASLPSIERYIMLARNEGQTYQEIAEGLSSRRRVGPPVLLPSEPSRLGTVQIYNAVRRVMKRLK